MIDLIRHLCFDKRISEARALALHAFEKEYVRNHDFKQESKECVHDPDTSWLMNAARIEETEMEMGTPILLDHGVDPWAIIEKPRTN